MYALVHASITTMLTLRIIRWMSRHPRRSGER